MTHLSLFSGVGGIDLAAEWAGFETVALVERDAYCQKVLAKNFPGAPIYDDITTFDGSEFRGVKLVSAGFPCQPHSLAGKRQASGDERDLWGEVVRVLGEAQPEWFVGENVPGLFSSESGRFFGRVVDDLAQMGLSVGWGMWGASDVGAVHRRKRVFILAHAEHKGLHESEIGGSVSHIKNKRRLQQPERCPATGAEKLLGNGNQSERQVSESGNRDREADAGNAQRKRLEGQGKGRPTADATTANPNSIPGPQTSTSACAIGEGRFTWDDALRSLGRGDWRTWSLEPTICTENARLPRWLVRDRVAMMKALGNAVCPHQAYPIFDAIANEIRKTT